jgi:hypothetical protein
MRGPLKYFEQFDIRRLSVGKLHLQNLGTGRALQRLILLRSNISYRRRCWPLQNIRRKHRPSRCTDDKIRDSGVHFCGVPRAKITVHNNSLACAV